MTAGFLPSRAFPYAHDAIEHIEEHNCSRGRGCTKGAGIGSAKRAEFGPGGLCGVLAVVALGNQPVPELALDGDTVTCSAYDPRPEPPPRVHRPPPPPPGQLSLEEPT